MVRKYEVLYILKHDSPQEKTDATRAKMREIIESQGGMIAKEDVWGKRKLAFEVKKFQKGIYVHLVFLSQPDGIMELERNLKINAEVIRFLTVKLKDEVNLEEEKAEKERWEQELALRQAQPPPPEAVAVAGAVAGAEAGAEVEAKEGEAEPADADEEKADDEEGDKEPGKEPGEEPDVEVGEEVGGEDDH